MHLAVKLIFLLVFGISTAQTNLLDTSTWTVGNGSVTGYNVNGTDAQNVREIGTNPFGDSVVLWKAIPDESSDPDGGWQTDRYSIDPTKTYRFSVWMKKTNSEDGNTLFGLRAYSATNVKNCLNLDGSINTNPYFFSGDLPQLNNWFLVIGYVHDSSYSTTLSIGGVYDINGVKTMDLTDFKFSTDSAEIFNRAFLYYDSNINDRLYFWEPTIYEVNGMEPSIEELITPNSTNSGTTVWNSSGSGIDYTVGNVGIGTEAQANYKLAVNGKIHAKEVKVDLDGWADYVFTEDYRLPTLEEVERHIREKGHLVNVPSAAEVEKNGIELGQMDRMLLEKIEELTLYILQQDKIQKKQDKIQRQLEKRVKLLEKTDK